MVRKITTPKRKTKSTKSKKTNSKKTNHISLKPKNEELITIIDSIPPFFERLRFLFQPGYLLLYIKFKYLDDKKGKIHTKIKPIEFDPKSRDTYVKRVQKMIKTKKYE